MPNIFAKDGRINGFIDLGKMGPADRWQDIAIALRSIDHNFAGKHHAGKHHGGKRFFDFQPEMLLNELGTS